MGYHGIEKPLRNKGFGVLKESGGQGATGMRTWMGLELLAGVPHDRWRSHPYLVWPIAAFVPEVDIELTPREQSVHSEHPVSLALKWRHLLDSEPSLTPATIARTQGISPSRIRQILRLATLAPEILETLQAMSSSELKKLGETRLRPLVPLSRDEQLKSFNELASGLRQKT